MKKLGFLFILTLAFVTKSYSQAATASADEPSSTLKKALELQMPEGGGARAASVVWYSQLSRYYAPKSGNASFPFGVYNASGDRISPSDLTAGFDIRGFWYSPVLGAFCANGYNDGGWIKYNLDSRSMPTGTTSLVTGMKQPNEHSVAAYNPDQNVVYFLDGQYLRVYDPKTFKSKDDIRLYPGSVDKSYYDAVFGPLYKSSEMPVEYNYTSPIYTGIPNQEIGLLNVTDKKIELYDKSTGFLTKKLSLPDDAPVETLLCFSYANGMYWLYNTTTKSWYGYK